MPDPLMNIQRGFWLGLNLVSMTIALYSIAKLFVAVKTLQETDAKIDFNKWSMLLHTVFVIFSSLVIMSDVATAVFAYQKMLVTEIVICVDTILQLIICYICWTMGSSETLKRYKCNFIKDVQGGVRVRYELIQSQISTKTNDD